LVVDPGSMRVALVGLIGRTIPFDGPNVFVGVLTMCRLALHGVLLGGLLRVFPPLRYDRSNMERTLAIIKPDAVAARHTGRIIQRIEEAGFQIRAMKLLHLNGGGAEGFYAVHRERPFFASLTKFMSSGPVVVLALEAPDAIKKWRTLMGATDPAKADAGTLRKEFGRSIENNATHGSDAPDTAAFELGYFFSGMELTG
jgi:nucleoside-diphosphate kinase